MRSRGGWDIDYPCRVEHRGVLWRVFPRLKQIGTCTLDFHSGLVRQIPPKAKSLAVTRSQSRLRELCIIMAFGYLLTNLYV
jgi:hypothetical protein